MAPRITLWGMDASPPTWAVRMLADILGIDVDYKVLDFMNLEHKSPKMLKLNPMGTVPVIQDGDFNLPESHTIMTYLLEKYGQQHKERLYPSDIKARALVNQVMYFDTGVVFIRIKLVALPALFEGVDHLKPEVAKQIDDAYEIVNDYLTRNVYVAGDRLTIADLALGTSVLAIDSVYPVKAVTYPKVIEWLARLKQESFFSKIAVPGAATTGSFIKGAWEQNKKK